MPREDAPPPNPASSNPSEGSWLERVGRFPTEPGIYLMRDAQREVIYVGKAANLRARLRSYFSASGDDRPFVRLLEGLLGDIETIAVSNEKEALLLENTLIKRYRPRFNVKLRDDKAFLVIRIDPKAQFPRAELVRRVDPDGAHYFGPYPSARAVREMQRLLNRHFRLRSCSDHVLGHRQRPCLQHSMGRCSAPCVGLVDAAAYAREVEGAVLFLGGRTQELVEALKARMQAAAEALAFEDAARLRDQVRAVEQSMERQRVVLAHGGDQDIHALHRAGSRVALATLHLRQGVVWGQRSTVLEGMAFPDEEVISQYINLLYDRGLEVPPVVVLPRSLEDQEAKAQWLSEKRGSRVRVQLALRGDQKRLLEMTRRNAALALGLEEEAADSKQRTLAGLAKLLGLERPPRRIECVDISAFHGDQAVGSVVAFRDAEPDRDRYRRYKIKTVEGSDDFAMMQEVLRRRLGRGQREGDLPDLLVVDGGLGQLGVAEAVCAELGLTSPALAGLAKSRVQGLRGDGSGAAERSSERVFRPGASLPIVLAPESAECHLLQRLRDEAHRFAITFHRKRRAQATVGSALETIPGVGPARRRELLRRFGSLQGVRAASPEELGRLPGIGPALAERILRALGRNL